MNVKGLNKLIKRIEKAEKDVERKISKEIESTTLIARNTAIENAPKDKGQLRQGINFKKLKNTAFQLFSQMHYTIPQEFGTGSKIDVPTDIPESLRQAGLKFKFSKFGASNPRSITPKLFMTKAYREAKQRLETNLPKILNERR